MPIGGVENFLLFALIIMRISGAIFLNPVFGRTSIPNTFKTGLVLVLSFTVYPLVPASDIVATNSIMFAVLALKEFFVGYFLGFIMSIYEMVSTFSGTVMDAQMGLSMASVYDPQTGVQTALTGRILQLYFLLLFFAVDGHLAFIKIVATSYTVLPYGNFSIGDDVMWAVIMMFTECVFLAVKLAFPIIGFEFLVEVGIGLMMRIIPQVNLFILSIQLRIIVGMVILGLLISPIGDYLLDTIAQMIDSMQGILMLMGS